MAKGIGNKVKPNICFCVYNYNFNRKKPHHKKEVDTTSFSYESKLYDDKKKVAYFQPNGVPRSVNTLSKSRVCFGSKLDDNEKAMKLKSLLQEPNSMRSIRLCKLHESDGSSSTPKPNLTLVFDENHVLKCNSDLLKKFSGFFNRLLTRNVTEINMCGQCIKGQTFLTCYKWMRNKCDDIIDENNIVDVLCACLHLEISELETSCWRLLCDDEVYQGEKAYKIYKRSLDKGFHYITTLMIRRLVKFFPLLMYTDCFLESGKDYLIPLLNSNELVCESEEVAFLAVCRWINHDIKERWDKLNQIIDSVRFGLMTSHQLFDIKNSDTIEIRHIVKHSDVRRKIENAIVLNSLKTEFNYPNDEEKKIGFWLKCRQLGVDLPQPRNCA